MPNLTPGPLLRSVRDLGAHLANLSDVVLFLSYFPFGTTPGRYIVDALGIGLGASSLQSVRLRKDSAGIRLVHSEVATHEADPRERLRALLEALSDRAGLRVAVTGRKFRHRLALASISEPEAIELAAAHCGSADRPCRIVIAAGGETFMVYHLDSRGRIQGIHTGNKCASGTGEFFLQQIGRMGLGLDDLAGLETPETHHAVSGRCSVFCKSDCTHALNKGVPKGEVVAGLARMMAGKILELVKKLPPEPVMLVGGCAANTMMVDYLREGLPDLFIPTEAPFFEAFGAALWALENETRPADDLDAVFLERGSAIPRLKPLSEFRAMVDFKTHPRGQAHPGDPVIVGLDVGSTTTKGVVMLRCSRAIVAAEYLRTNGDPVGASRQVYASLAAQLAVPVRIEGLGVTGSGRQIAGLHAMTDAVINEIVAHAAAAAHFDPDVDTIFEIGGQDAKYTHLTHGVPSDYAMNEACSAGTGSFLEEAARESLGVDMKDIAAGACRAQSPPNFNDQCAAFIASDIKNAAQEGMSSDDILAGLVYSVCMNYTHRVKGNRPVGAKVFMQGGVCYNEAVPAAMAAITGKRIVVPPEPGLMGALGVAIEVERRIGQGLLETGAFDLAALAARELNYAEPFVCRGGKEHCDLKCEISLIEVDGKRYPFGGVCNRYDNLIHHRKRGGDGLNLVAERERRIFRDAAPGEGGGPSVGLNRSFMMHTWFPFFRRFLSELGARVVLSEALDETGADQQGAPFCFPVEIAHGYLAHLLKQQPDFVFLPHLRGVPVPGEDDPSCTCVFVQSEPYYLQAAFPGLADRVLSPYLDFSKGLEPNRDELEGVARALGANPRLVPGAMQAAWAEQQQCMAELRALGRDMLARLESDSDGYAVVLFGRAYNSFTSCAHKGIPAKLATRGIPVIPIDLLPFEDESVGPEHNMYWSTGRQILKAARFVEKHPKLFAVYITNFSCGPDSFLTGFFRETMGSKPSLTLELDNHTADAGLETRIEAFLDVVRYYRQLKQPEVTPNGFKAASVESRDGKLGLRTADGAWYPLHHERVKVVLPVLGRYSTELAVKAFEMAGIRAEVLPPADEEVLKLGRGNSTCKECLPLQTTIGSMLHYLRNRPEGEITAYFLADTDGPCRFGQYNVYSTRLIEKHRIPDAAVVSFSSANNYGGMSSLITLAAWRALVIGDVLEEIRATLLAAAREREAALRIFDREYEAIRNTVHRGWRKLSRQLSASARVLADIPLKKPYAEIPKLSLIGEIYVRRDPIALQNLVERLADRGYIVRTSQTSEWFKYIDWLFKSGLRRNSGPIDFWVRYFFKQYFDRRIRERLAPSGLFFHDGARVEPVVKAGSALISPKLTGEAILTVGSALHEILHPACGIIAIGPFGCMPNRVAEAILNEKFTTSTKCAVAANNGGVPDLPLLKEDRRLPFLAIETDGNTFPQIIEARLEAFCLQAERLHQEMLSRH